MLYLLQVMIYSVLLYTVYILFLKNRASHQWNRFYLLVCAGLPLAMPFIEIPVLYNTGPASAKAINVLAPAITVFAQKQTMDSFNGWGNLLSAAYIAVSISMLLPLVHQFFLFKRFVGQHNYQLISGVAVLVNAGAGPGSFMGYVFLPGTEINPAIFEHELAHIRLKHSYDILFIRLLQSFIWPNITLAFILKELKMAHEFQADACAAKNETAYINILLNNVFNTKRFSLSHTFFSHPLKRRIMMLTTPVSRTKLRMAKWKAIALAAILTAGCVYVQSCKHAENKVDNAVPQHVAGNIPDGTANIYSYTDNMPQAGYDVHQFLADNTKYPESARKKGIEGRVIVKFVVNEDGSISNPVIIRSPDPVLSEEALRVMRLMPKWKPGSNKGKNVAVYFTLPIVFQLGNDTGQPFNGLTKLENDTLGKLLEKAGHNKSSLTAPESNTVARLMQKIKN